MKLNVEQLVQEMTLEEKAGLCSGGKFLVYQGGRTARDPGHYGDGRSRTVCANRQSRRIISV